MNKTETLEYLEDAIATAAGYSDLGKLTNAQVNELAKALRVAAIALEQYLEDRP